MSAADTTHEILGNAEDDVRSVPELLSVIETIANLAMTANGLDADECKGLFRLAVHTAHLARKVETMWDQAWIASGGRA
jgi:hypothetical protein